MMKKENFPITLNEKAHNLLKEAERERESFSEIIIRIFMELDNLKHAELIKSLHIELIKSFFEKQLKKFMLSSDNPLTKSQQDEMFETYIKLAVESFKKGKTL